MFEKKKLNIIGKEEKAKEIRSYFKVYIGVGASIILVIFLIIFTSVSAKLSPERIIEEAKKNYIYHSGAIHELQHNLDILKERIKIHELEIDIAHKKAELVRKENPQLNNNEKKKTK